MTAQPHAADATVVWSRPESERRGTHLVVLLHGYGSQERDLMGLVPALPDEGFTYAALRAPAPVPGGAGFQWFPLEGGPGAFTLDPDQARAAARGVADWVGNLGPEYASVILLGFSQGMAVATSVARLHPELVRAVVGLSGFVVEDSQLAAQDAELAARTPRLPVFYGRDQEDPVVGQDMAAATLDWLREHADPTKVVYAGMGHAVSNQEIGHVSEFLRHVVR